MAGRIAAVAGLAEGSDCGGGNDRPHSSIRFFCLSDLMAGIGPDAQNKSTGAPSSLEQAALER